jgi:hypothetical protein
VTVEPIAKPFMQVGLQLRPAGTLVTVPPPAPARVTVRFLAAAKSKDTVMFASIVTTHVRLNPEQPPPLQPLKTDPPGAEAVKVTVATV